MISLQVQVLNSSWTCRNDDQGQLISLGGLKAPAARYVNRKTFRFYWSSMGAALIAPHISLRWSWFFWISSAINISPLRGLNRLPMPNPSAVPNPPQTGRNDDQGRDLFSRVRCIPCTKMVVRKRTLPGFNLIIFLKFFHFIFMIKIKEDNTIVWNGLAIIVILWHSTVLLST